MCDSSVNSIVTEEKTERKIRGFLPTLLEGVNKKHHIAGEMPQIPVSGQSGGDEINSCQGCVRWLYSQRSQKAQEHVENASRDCAGGPRGVEADR